MNNTENEGHAPRIGTRQSNPSLEMEKGGHAASSCANCSISLRNFKVSILVHTRHNAVCFFGGRDQPNAKGG